MYQQKNFKSNLAIVETSDRSTESESTSPEGSTRKKTNLQFERMRVGIQGLLFSKEKSSPLGGTRQNSISVESSNGPDNTVGETKVQQKVRKFSSPIHVKGNSLSISPRPRKYTIQDLNNSSNDYFKLQETNSASLLHLPSRASLSEESCFGETEKNQENAFNLQFIPFEPEDGKIGSPSDKSVVNEEEDSEFSSDAEEGTHSVRQSIFLINMEKDIEELKQELQVADHPNIHFIKGDFYTYYKEGKILGQGTSGVVKECTKVNTTEKFAVKVVHYRNDDEILVLIVKEFKNHIKLNHKNIIKVYELYIDYFSKRIYTVMELTDCKEMFEVIKNLGHYSESIASGIFKQILTGINYLHLSGVCHRDLKPNNILVSKDGKVVKITDFNVSKFMDKSQKYSSLSPGNFKMWTHTGTIAFTAPEMFDNLEYTEAIDMWSAGTVLYTMLCGYQPFQSEYVQDLIQLIKEAKYDFPPDSWSTISEEAKHLIRWCLNPNYKKRCSPSEALMHPWIANRGKVPNTSLSGVKDFMISSLVVTRPRGESSTNAVEIVDALSPKETFERLNARRRHSGIDNFNFKFFKNTKEQTKRHSIKLFSKIAAGLKDRLIEANPQEESSPQITAIQSSNKVQAKVETGKNEDSARIKEKKLIVSLAAGENSSLPNNENKGGSILNNLEHKENRNKEIDCGLCVEKIEEHSQMNGLNNN